MSGAGQFGAPRRPKDWPQFLVASQRIGANPQIVQAGGGNTSMKGDGQLHVKASGFWLRDCLDREMFVDLDLGLARSIAASGGEDFFSALLAPGPGTPKPSIETGFHALMPHPVVFHAHPVNAIAATLTPSGRGRLDAALRDVAWAMVEYVKPGATLALALNKAIEEKKPDLVILANHGVVAGAASVDAAARMFTDLESRLDLPRASARPTPPTAAPQGYEPIIDGPAAELAALPAPAEAISRHAIVPDQVVYLGGAPVFARTIVEAERLAAGRSRSHGVAPGLAFAEGGAFARSGMSASGMAMIGLVCEIGLRLAQGEEPATLTLDDELALLNWDAEKHRQQVDANRTGA